MVTDRWSTSQICGSFCQFYDFYMFKSYKIGSCFSFQQTVMGHGSQGCIWAPVPQVALKAPKWASPLWAHERVWESIKWRAINHHVSCIRSTAGARFGVFRGGSDFWICLVFYVFLQIVDFFFLTWSIVWKSRVVLCFPVLRGETQLYFQSCASWKSEKHICASRKVKTYTCASAWSTCVLPEKWKARLCFQKK